MQPHSSKPDQKNLILAIAISIVIILLWEFLYATPQRQVMLAQQHEQQERRIEATEAGAIPTPTAPVVTQTREQALAAGQRLPIRSEHLHGSIDLKGLRFNDLTLAKYRETINPSSPEVVLLSPATDKTSYFAELGWTSADSALKLPDSSSIWQTTSTELAPGKSATFQWDNGQGVTFENVIALDNLYMFTVTQRVINRSGRDISVSSYGRIKRAHDQTKNEVILHEGPIAVLNGTLIEHGYKQLREEGAKKEESTGGWIGMSDKYWLAALVPQGSAPFAANFTHENKDGSERYQADVLNPSITVRNAMVGESKMLMFAGAKEIKALDHYMKDLNIPLFDRAVDFGSLYFLTKPIFLLLTYFYSLLGNFGLAIALLTVVIKLLMFPLANKSYGAMSQMKRLTPQMNQIRERYPDAKDRMKMNQEVMELYKREKVNPASGCLPLLIQLPVFFALYKVLYVTIEMRHAPFYGWIKDLSAIDPTNVFTLFGLIDWVPPSFLPHIGLLPILMCATMVIQQKINPKPTDPSQAIIMTVLPYLFLFMFASFPSGLVLYWTWSNLLTIVQQLFIMRRHEAKAQAKEVKG